MTKRRVKFTLDARKRNEEFYQDFIEAYNLDKYLDEQDFYENTYIVPFKLFGKLIAERAVDPLTQNLTACLNVEIVDVDKKKSPVAYTERVFVATVPSSLNTDVIDSMVQHFCEHELGDFRKNALHDDFYYNKTCQSDTMSNIYVYRREGSNVTSVIKDDIPF